MKELAQDAAVAGLKVAPPAAVAAASQLGGMTLNDVMLLATIAYVALQSGWLLVRWYWQWTDRKSGKRVSE